MRTHTRAQDYGTSLHKNKPNSAKGGTDWGGEYTAKKVTIEALDDSRFELDGEIIKDTKLDIEVVHNKLKMFR